MSAFLDDATEEVYPQFVRAFPLVSKRLAAYFALPTDVFIDAQ